MNNSKRNGNGVTDTREPKSNNGEDDVVDSDDDDIDVNDDNDDDDDDDELSDYGDIDQYKKLTPEQIKTKLRQLGLMLKSRVKEVTKKYYYDDIAFETIDKVSKKINKCESRNGKYLSLVIRDEEIYRKYMKVHLIKTRNEGRLDMAVADWLRRFNPHIIELTSYERAKWVTESFVRLYENEWKTLYSSTRAKHIARITDREILESIKDATQFCFKRCREIAWSQSVFILRHLYFSTKHTINDCPATVRLRIRELMKRVASYTLPFVQTVIKRDLVREPNLRILTRAQKTQKPPLRTFLDLCVEVMWFMQTQDPTMTLNFTKDNEPLHFNPYKTSGSQIDYTIWPTVLLHYNGKVLANGVAEFVGDSAPNSPLVPINKRINNRVNYDFLE